jgi:hypothetical protein
MGTAADLVVEVRTGAPQGARLGLDGLGPQALELLVLQMLEIPARKGFGVVGRVDAAGVPWRIYSKVKCTRPGIRAWA